MHLGYDLATYYIELKCTSGSEGGVGGTRVPTAFYRSDLKVQ